MPINVKDPRSLVTPDALDVAPPLLGLPLARPARRLGAMLIDLALIGTLTALLSGVQLFLWGTVGLLLLHTSVLRPARLAAGPHASMLLRVSLGCLGLSILSTVLLVTGVLWMRDRSAGGPVVVEVGEGGPAVSGLAAEGIDSARGSEGRVPVDSLDVEQALLEYASLLAEGPAEEASLPGERAQALRLRLLPVLGGDTLDALAGALEDAQDERAELEEQVETLTEEGGGFVALLRDVWDQLGSAVGLWSLYFTVLLTIWNGQTVGKRLLGIRVLRLDGEPLTWWASFERAGGYAAGLATGLLGFAQMLWDSNRQCVHDKIVGTVVVLAGAPATPWAEARPAPDWPTGLPSDGEEP